MRRQLAGLLSLLMLLGLLSGCAGDIGEPETRIRDDLLGTVITLTVYGGDADEVIGRMFSRIEEVDRAMSLHRADSELSLAAAAAGQGVVTVGPDTIETLSVALEVSALSSGALNPAVGPLVQLWGIGTAGASLPTQSRIDAVLPLLDPSGIRLEGAQLHLEQEGMAADLGGVAKGYACDAAVEVLREAEIKRALLDLGGNIYAHGTRPDGNPWRIGLRSPIIGENGIVGTLSVTDATVVTSGGYERYLEEGGTIYHHILDSSTGYPADSGLLAVTIVARSSTWADALSTACFVLGLEEGQALIRKVMEEYHKAGLQGAVFITKGYDIHIVGDLDLALQDSRFRVAS